MSEALETLHNGATIKDTPSIATVVTIMEYINGLMVGSVPQEFYNLMTDIFGVQNVNRMVALGGVKYIKAILQTATQKVENSEGKKTLEDVIREEREQVIYILDKIFGE